MSTSSNRTGKYILVDCAFCGQEFLVKEEILDREDFVNICELCFDQITLGEEDV